MQIDEKSSEVDSDGENCKSSKNKSKKKKKELWDDYELPPIENLQITVKEEDAQLIGTVVQIINNQGTFEIFL